MDIPEKMIEAQAQQMVEEFAQNIAMQDMATRYQMEKEKVADLLSDDDKKNLRNDICLKKAAKFVTSKAK